MDQQPKPKRKTRKKKCIRKNGLPWSVFAENEIVQVAMSLATIVSFGFRIYGLLRGHRGSQPKLKRGGE